MESYPNAPSKGRWSFNKDLGLIQHDVNKCNSCRKFVTHYSEAFLYNVQSLHEALEARDGAVRSEAQSGVDDLRRERDQVLRETSELYRRIEEVYKEVQEIWGVGEGANASTSRVLGDSQHAHAPQPGPLNPNSMQGKSGVIYS